MDLITTLEHKKNNLFNKEKLKVCAKDFELLKSLGRGAHGKVLLCRSKID